MKLASQDTDTECIKDEFTGPCALAITYEDVAEPAKILVDLSKEMKNLEIKVGQISGSPIDPTAIKKLADLPSRDQLLSLVLSAMQAVPTSLVRALNGVPLNLIYALKAIEAEKGKE
jgi:large subunit ribosomal protein L10